MRLQKGFTIVELLIVIVVIALLAAITIVAYSGIQNRANDATVQADLSNAAKQIALNMVDNSEYPAASPTGLTPLGLKASRGSYDTVSASYNFSYCTNATSPRTAYALVGMSKSGKVYYASSSGKGISTATSGNRSSACDQIGLTYGGSGTGDATSGVSSGTWQSWVN